MGHKKFHTSSNDTIDSSTFFAPFTYVVHSYTLFQSQRLPNGACRSVKFAPNGSVDLLAFSEHISYVSLIDSRTFNARQSIDVSKYYVGDDISGISFSPEGSSFFVANCNSIIQYKIDHTTRRYFSESSIV